MALLVVGGRSESLGWQLSMWGLLDALCSKKKSGGFEDGTMTLLKSKLG